MSRAWLLAATCWLCMTTGCITKDTGRSGGDVVWHTGVTTRRDVVARWGNPDAVHGDTWIWKGSRLVGGKVKAAYMLLGVTVSNAEVSTRQVRVTFDAEGRLVSVSADDTIIGGPAWSLVPW